MYSFHYPQKGGDFLKEVPRLYNANYKKARRFKFLSLIKKIILLPKKAKNYILLTRQVTLKKQSPF